MRYVAILRHAVPVVNGEKGTVCAAKVCKDCKGS